MASATERDTSTTITCTATGVPVPTVSWTGPDGSIMNDSKYTISDTNSPVMVTDGSNVVFQVTSDLTIMSVVRMDGGVYYCVATNVVNTVQSNTTLTVMCKF